MLTLDDVRAHLADAEVARALAASDDEALARRLSQLLTTVEPVPMYRLAAWAAPAIRGRLEAHAANSASPLQSICLTALDLLRGSMVQRYDVVAYGHMLDALLAGGVITAADLAALRALATVPRPVSANEVARVVRRDDGTPTP